jgi:hypothetical protein
MTKRLCMPTLSSPFSVVADGQFLVTLNTAILVERQVKDLLLDMHRLNGFEQTFICADTFLTEAQAGGVGQFFESESAVLYDKVLIALTEIGAHRLRHQVEQYVAHVFGPDLPRKAEARTNFLHALSAEEDHDAERTVDALV